MEEMRNPSCVLYGAGQVKVEDRPVPEIKDAYDVIIKIRYVGVCGSDVHFWKHGGISTKVDPTRGLIMGHETSGVVHAVGSKVKRLQIGDHVAIEPGVPCRRCSHCKHGVYNLCSGMRFAAAPPDSDGTLTHFYRTQEDFVFRIDGHSLEEVVLVEPLAVAVHAARLASIQAGDTVVVIGAGTVGLLSGAVALAFGATDVVSVDIMKAKLDFAKAWIGDSGKNDKWRTFQAETDSTAEGNAREICNLLGVSGVDVVLEVSGAASAIDTSIQVLRQGGRYVQVGIGRPRVEFPIVTFSEKEILMRGCFRYGSGDFELAAKFINKDWIRVGALISKVFAFNEASLAWDATARGEGIKNLIRVAED